MEVLSVVSVYPHYESEMQKQVSMILVSTTQNTCCTFKTI